MYVKTYVLLYYRSLQATTASTERPEVCLEFQVSSFYAFLKSIK